MTKDQLEKQIKELEVTRDAIVEEANRRIHEHNGAIAILQKLLADMEASEDND